MTSQIGVDVGGTFTDVVAWDGSHLETRKVASTPEDQSKGVMAGVRSFDGVGRLLHGTTVATNALLERRGARTALVTSAGFEDILEIGRQHRPALYDSSADRPEPLVTRGARFGVAADGSIPSNVDLSDFDAVAVSLLYGYERRDDERRLGAALADRYPGLDVTLASEVTAEFREYERTATAVLNAFLVPETGRYLRRLRDNAIEAGVSDEVLVMRSSGGLIPVSTAAGLPVSVLLSGPAGGVRAAAALGSALGRDRIISFDMGGTSTDVSRIEDGRPEVAYERAIAGHPCRMPAIAINTVGAGGGSIAWQDPGGALRVGPHSAGAVPGPACYGTGGTAVTVTDANVVLGRLPASIRLGGAMALDVAAARTAVDRLASTLGLDAAVTAAGVLRIVEEVMAGAIRTVSVQQGADPREASLVAFGGAGGLHAAALAKALDMREVLVPPHAGVFSALGLLLSPTRIDVAQSRLLGDDDDAALWDAVGNIIRTGRAAFQESTGRHLDAVDVFVDARYVGQSHEITVPYFGEGWESIVTSFTKMHHEQNGFARIEDPIEVVTVRAEVTGSAVVDYAELPSPQPQGPVTIGSTPLQRGSDTFDAALINRQGLAPGDEIVGPAVVLEDEASTFLDKGERAVVLDGGTMEIGW